MRYTENFKNLQVISNGVGKTVDGVSAMYPNRTTLMVGIADMTMPQIVELSNHVKLALRGTRHKQGDPRVDVYRTRFSKIKVRHGHQGFTVEARLDFARAYGTFKAEVRRVLNLGVAGCHSYSPMFMTLELNTGTPTDELCQHLDLAYGERLPHGYDGVVHVWMSHLNLWGENPDRIGAGLRVVLTNHDGRHYLSFISF